MAKQFAAVSKKAAVQRINRKLLRDGECLRASRGARALIDLGAFYVVDVNRNCIVRKDIDLEAYGREVGAVEAWEKIAE